MIRVCQYQCLLVLLFLVIGCGSTKKMQSSVIDTHHNVVEQIDIAVEEKSEFIRQEETEKTESSTESSGKVTHHIEYDTDKEKDPETGEHPKKSETWIVEGSLIQSVSHESSVVQEEEGYSFELEDNSSREENFDNTESNDSQVTRKGKGIGWLYAILGTMIVGYFVCRFLKKRGF